MSILAFLGAWYLLWLVYLVASAVWRNMTIFHRFQEMARVFVRNAKTVMAAFGFMRREVMTGNETIEVDAHDKLFAELWGRTIASIEGDQDRSSWLSLGLVLDDGTMLVVKPAVWTDMRKLELIVRPRRS